MANTTVANSTSHGTSRAKKVGGVTSSSVAPSTPPTRLMTNRARNDKAPIPALPSRPAQPVVIWPGKSATVEVMLAARGSSPDRISAGQGDERSPARQRVLGAGPKPGAEKQKENQHVRCRPPASAQTPSRTCETLSAGGARLGRFAGLHRRGRRCPRPWLSSALMK